MEELLGDFIIYLHDIKKASENTEISYKRDLSKMLEFFSKKGINDMTKVTETDLSSFVLYLESKNFTASTVSRNIASVKAFFHYLVKEDFISYSPAENLRAPKVVRKTPRIMTPEELIRLLEAPTGDSPKDIRDKAMLELLFATGIRVTELISLGMDDVRMDCSFIVCHDGEQSRTIPVGDNAQNALKRYAAVARNSMVKDDSVDSFFVNCSGLPMSRQGFWKLIKYYAKKAAIEVDVTPYTLRHSFAAHLVLTGANQQSVNMVLGQSENSSTKVYNDMVQARLKRVSDMLRS